METLDEEQQSTTRVDQLATMAKISISTEIMEEILSRLPVKSILRFRSVSKPWLSSISDPSFTKLHSTRAHRTALFISAYDEATRKRHFLSAASDGGPVAHLMTLDEAYSTVTTQAEHLNGLVFFTCVKWDSDDFYVVNPSTRKIFKLPDPYAYTDGEGELGYFFGFDEYTNEHKVLMIKKLVEPTRFEVMIFSLSNRSWRMINAEAPIGFSWDTFYYESSVCVNSVVHIMLLSSYDILAFDLRTEKFSIVTTPKGVKSHESSWRSGVLLKRNRVHITKINGCVGVVCHYRAWESNEMHIWMLQDYENRVWVKEIITFLESWIELDGTSPFPFPLDVNMDEIFFCPQNRVRLSFPHVFDQTGNEMSVPIYSKSSRCSKSLQFTMGHQFQFSKNVKFDEIKCYVESMVPL